VLSARSLTGKDAQVDEQVEGLGCAYSLKYL
jgi:hypothetical protein